MQESSLFSSFEETRDCCLRAAGTRAPSLVDGGISLTCLELWWEAWDSSPGTMGNSGTTPVVSETQSPFELQGSAGCSGVTTGESGLNSH